jgi:formate dehydrogenase accessory protein FdhE
MARDLWTAAVARAEALANADAAASTLLTFAAALLRAQREIYVYLHQGHLHLGTLHPGTLPPGTLPAGPLSAGRGDRAASSPLTGRLDADLPRLRPLLLPLLTMVAAQGPEPLARGALELRSVHPSALDEMLIDYWHAPADDQFFAKAILQPYARALADSQISPAVRPADRDQVQPDVRCPFCGGAPQLAVLRATETQADGGRRHLLCAICLTVWPFRRILCPHCGEEDERKLGYFHAADSPYRHVRVEVCATCQHYLKSVDLATAGLAVPLVDEIAASALDVWARDQGLTKIERNLVGL